MQAESAHTPDRSHQVEPPRRVRRLARLLHLPLSRGTAQPATPAQSTRLAQPPIDRPTGLNAPTHASQPKPGQSPVSPGRARRRRPHQRSSADDHHLRRQALRRRPSRRCRVRRRTRFCTARWWSRRVRCHTNRRPSRSTGGADLVEPFREAHGRGAGIPGLLSRHDHRARSGVRRTVGRSPDLKIIGGSRLSAHLFSPQKRVEAALDSRSTPRAAQSITPDLRVSRGKSVADMPGRITPPSSQSSVRPTSSFRRGYFDEWLSK
jgi:hypothetical protein